MSSHIFLTGAAGLLGRYLLRDLLLEGMKVAVLLRPRGSEPVEARMEQVLAQTENELGKRLPRPVCLAGDITAPECGLDTNARRWVSDHCSSVLHNAASLTFEGSDRSRDPWLSNLGGTQNVLNLCQRTGLADLHYVSTAYVCGLQDGPVRESDLDRGQAFRNDYEASKFEAEKQVRSATFLRQVTVHRPAIIVGDSRTGYTSTYHGLYSYLQFIWMLSRYAEREADGRWHVGVRLNVTGDEPRNLVPVDWVSAVMTRIVLQPRLHGRTYHLAPRQPVTARELEAAMSATFSYYGPTFVGADGLTDDLNETETAFYEYVGRYSPYWSREPIFDCTNTTAAAPDLPCPPVDLPLLRRLIEFAVEDRWGKGKAKRAPRRREEVPVTG